MYRCSYRKVHLSVWSVKEWVTVDLIIIPANKYVTIVIIINSDVLLTVGARYIGNWGMGGMGNTKMDGSLLCGVAVVRIGIYRIKGLPGLGGRV
jgi:hypothetical protein